MADKKLDKILEQAQKAYQQNDKRQGAQLIGEILREDFNHPGAWKVLYSVFGTGQAMEDFQRAFTQKYYPERLPLLSFLPPETSSGPVAPNQKPSFISRMFKSATGKLGELAKKPAEKPATQSPPTPGTKTAAEKPSPPTPSERPTPREELRTPVALSMITASPTRSEQKPSSPSSSTGQLKTSPVPTLKPLAPIAPAASPTPASAAPKQKIRVLVVDDIAQTRDNIIRSLRFQDIIEVVGTANSGEQAIPAVKETKPDVVIMDINMPGMDGIAATTAIRREVPYVQVIILTVQDDVDYIRKAMLAGARDFLSKPPMVDELMSAVLRAGELAQQERIKGSRIAASQAPTSIMSRGKIITVYSPRGGVGCTTLAANLAVVLYSEDTHVMVVDGNLQFGDIPVVFNVRNRNTVLDLTPRSSELDAELVEGVAMQHSSGIKVLGPATRPELADQVTPQQFSQTLQFLRTVYPYVIVDTSHRLADVTLAALDISDLVLVITTQDVPCIARVRKFIELVPLLKLNKQRLMIVMNQFDKRIGITPEKLASTFQQAVAAVIPLEREVVVPSVNRGTPFMLQKESLAHPVARAMLQLSEVIQLRLAQLEEAELAATRK